jgi:hypothetical protein
MASRRSTAGARFASEAEGVIVPPPPSIDRGGRDTVHAAAPAGHHGITFETGGNQRARFLFG